MQRMKSSVIALLTLVGTLATLQLPVQAGDYVLRYEKPAGLWKESLPLGNGHMGVTVFGGVERERLQLSEHSIYRAAGTTSRHLSAIRGEFKKEQRRMALAGQEEEAMKLSLGDFQRNWKGEKPKTITVDGFAKGAPKPFAKPAESTLGNLELFFAPFNAFEAEYSRRLDLNTATATTSFRVGGVTYTREVFCSNPDDVMVMKISASEKGKISFNAQLTRPTDLLAGRWNSFVERMIKGGASQYVDPVTPKVYGTDTVGFTGRAADEGTRFSAVVKAIATGGTTAVKDNRIVVENADEAVLIFSASTDYYHPENWERFALDQVNTAAKKTYDELLKTHLADYQEIFQRVDIQLGSTRADALPTDVRANLINIDEGYKAHSLEPYLDDRDPGIFALYFQFGRYLLISSSRKGYFFPGIVYWCPDLIGEWYGGHHDDINQEENYWPADLCNMSETLAPLFDTFEAWTPTARAVAEYSFGSRGIMICGLTPFGMAAFDGNWPGKMGWFAQHYWDHYAFNLDKEWLERQGYPFIKGAALFSLDYMVEDPRTGWLVTFPDWSPENRFFREEGKQSHFTLSPTMSVAVIREVLTNFVTASEVLGVDEDLRAEVQAALPKLPPFQINKHGGLQEWLKDFDEALPGHRHLSPLYPTYPGNQISPLTTPELAEAVKTSILRRLEYGEGYGYVGHSRSWMVNQFARLFEPDLAHEQLEVLIGKCALPNMFSTHMMGHRTIDRKTHCIEGNMAYTAGVAEMLVQSHLGFVHLLPSLPKEKWPRGHIKGIKARGGYVVDIEWQNGRLARAVIHSKITGTCPVRYGDKVVDVPVKAGESTVLDGALKVR